MKTYVMLMKMVFSVLFTFFTTYPSYSQSFYALKIDRRIRAEARDITAKYQPSLVMGVDQALEFQSTVARFLVKKKAVEEDDTLSPRARYDILKQLSSKETSAMADVLESYRWQEYMRLKKYVQPIAEPLNDEEELIVIHPRDH